MSTTLPAAPRSRLGRRWDTVRRVAGDSAVGALSIVAILLVWQAAVVLFKVEAFVSPAPSDILVRFINDFASGEILQPLLVTTVDTLLGFLCGVVIGAVLGVGIALVPFLEKSLYPSVLALQTATRWRSRRC